MSTTISRIAIPVAAVAVSGALGAGVAALSPSKDESFQTKLSAIIAGVGIVGGAGLIKASGSMADGGMVGGILGVAAIVVGGLVGVSALGSLAVDLSN